MIYSTIVDLKGKIPSRLNKLISLGIFIFDILVILFSLGFIALGIYLFVDNWGEISNTIFFNVNI